MNKQTTKEPEIDIIFDNDGSLEEVSIRDEKGVLHVRKRNKGHETKDNGLDKSVDVGYGMNIDVMK